MPAEVQVDVDDGVMVVTVNRPQARNAITQPVATAIAAAFDELDASGELMAAVLTGAGGRFCSGRDLKAALAGDHPWAPRRGFAGMVEYGSAKPLIAAVEGYALGGGFEIVLACDLVVSAASARFGLPEVRRGRIAGAGGLLRLPRRIPYHVAMELALTGEPMTAERAAHFGLVNRLTADGGALTEAVALARQIAENGPLAVAATKRVISESGTGRRVRRSSGSVLSPKRSGRPRTRSRARAPSRTNASQCGATDSGPAARTGQRIVGLLDRFRLDGTVAVVTGSGRGIGRGIALGLAEAGADVVATGRRRHEVAAVAAEVEDCGRRALAWPADLRDAGSSEELAQAATDILGPIGVWVNNAGGSDVKTVQPLADTSDGTEEINVDYSSYRAGSAARMTADAWVARAKALFTGLEASQHCLYNPRIDIDADSAVCVIYVQAEHFLTNDLGDNSFTLGGYYTDRLMRTGGGWKIAAKKLTVTWNRGNRHVLALAVERAAQLAGDDAAHLAP